MYIVHPMISLSLSLSHLLLLPHSSSTICTLSPGPSSCWCNIHGSTGGLVQWHMGDCLWWCFSESWGQRCMSDTWIPTSHMFCSWGSTWSRNWWVQSLNHFNTCSSYLMHAGPIWIDNLDCSRSHDTLSECDRNEWGVNNCDHTEDVGVICWPGM